MTVMMWGSVAMNLMTREAGMARVTTEQQSIARLAPLLVLALVLMSAALVLVLVAEGRPLGVGGRGSTPTPAPIPAPVALYVKSWLSVVLLLSTLTLLGLDFDLD